MRASSKVLLAVCLAWVVSQVALAQPAVDANTATRVELEAITGIGPSLADRIVQERGRGPFRSLDDLRARVRGVGDVKLRKMRDSGLVVTAPHAAGGTETLIGAPTGAAAGAKRPRRSRSAETKQTSGPRLPTGGTATIVGMPRN
jgi:competence ComEA-like helix-hairpin-helix protein